MSFETNIDYLYRLMNDFIILSCKEIYLRPLERDLTIRCNNRSEQLDYLLKLKKELIKFIDDRTLIEAYNLIDIDEIEGEFILNKKQFNTFFSSYFNKIPNIDETISSLTSKNNGNFELMISEIKYFFESNNLFTPEQLTNLSFYMYLLNSKIKHLDDPDKQMEELDLEYYRNPNYIFKNNGFKYFEKLRQNFPYHSGVTTKYTIIHDYLTGEKYLDCYKQDYIKFVRSHCSAELNGKKFSRFNEIPTYYNDAFKTKLDAILTLV